MTSWAVNVDRIERARVLNAWTRKHLANVAHVTPKTLTDMCSRRRRPTFGTVQAVCAALNLAIGDVIVFEDADGSDDSEPSVPASVVSSAFRASGATVLDSAQVR